MRIRAKATVAGRRILTIRVSPISASWGNVIFLKMRATEWLVKYHTAKRHRRVNRRALCARIKELRPMVSQGSTLCPHAVDNKQKRLRKEDVGRSSAINHPAKLLN